MPVVSFPVVGYGAVTSANDSSAKAEPGAYYVVRDTSNRYSIARYIRATSGFSQGECAVTDLATAVDYRVEQSAIAGDGYQTSYRGAAAATISSGNYGFIIVAGYIEKIDVSKTAASADFLCISASVAGKFTPVKSSSVWNGTIGTVTNATIPLVPFAQARSAYATGVGSAQILGFWG